MTAILLDTHVLVWFSEGIQDLKAPVANEIDRAMAQDQVLVSVFSFWEIAMLALRGRLSLNLPIETWTETVISTPGIDVAPLSPAVAIESAYLPGQFHRDPADQIIVATARKHDATLVTRDRDILRYAEQGHVKALAA